MDRKCLTACCHIIPACTVPVRSALCILSPREMEGRGASSREVEACIKRTSAFTSWEKGVGGKAGELSCTVIVLVKWEWLLFIVHCPHRLVRGRYCVSSWWRRSKGRRAEHAVARVSPLAQEKPAEMRDSGRTLRHTAGLSGTLTPRMVTFTKTQCKVFFSFCRHQVQL